MNESLQLQLLLDGKNIPITAFSSDGITLASETSATPRGIGIALEPGNAISEFRVRRIRQIQDWQPGEFRLHLTSEGGALVCRGVDQASLPFGIFRLRLMIADMIEVDQPIDISIPENRSLQVDLKYRSDPREVELDRPIADFDSEIRRVVEDPESLLDGLAASAWLASPAPRARRKACFLNLLAKLRAAAGPVRGSRLISGISSVFFADVDRIYARVSGNVLSDLRTLAKDPSKPFFFEGTPKVSIHQQVLRLAGVDPAAYELSSFRQEGKPAMQLVIASPRNNAALPHFADLDIDLGNPLQDVQGIVIHFGELLAPGKTDHLKLAGKLAKGATADFVYYKVVEASDAAKA